MALVTLPVGRYAVVIDAADRMALVPHRWSMIKTKSGKLYAQTAGITMHRLLTGAGIGQIVDHINGNTLDNRRANLRITDATGNRGNSVRKKTSSFRYKGLTKPPAGTTYQAKVVCRGVKHKSQRFPCQVCAALEYDRMATEQFGAMARGNFSAKGG